MKLEYRVLELEKGDEQECNFCFLDYNDPTLLNFDTASATHQMVARDTPDGYSDIVFICNECKKDYDNNALPRCEKCDRLKRNRNRCFCSRLKAKSTKPLSDKEMLSQAFSSRLENKTRELEQKLTTAEEEITTHLDALKVSEDWYKRQKQELLDKNKNLEKEVKQLREENKQLKNQIEVKPNKKSFLLFGKKS